VPSVEAGFEYEGGIVPRRSDREEEILKAAKMAAEALDLSGRAGIDLVIGDLPRVVDVNPRPTTSIVGITKVIARGAGGPDPEGEVQQSAGEGEGGGTVRVQEGGSGDLRSLDLNWWWSIPQKIALLNQ